MQGILITDGVHTNMHKLLFGFLCMFSLLFAQEQQGGKTFEALIVGYNHGVIQASKKSKFDHLQEYLTQEIYHKTWVWLESYHYNNLFMDSLLLSLKFKNFQRQEYTATMETSELWKYRYIFTKENKVVQNPKEVKYNLRYYFILQRDGKWKINHIKILNEKSYEIEETKK